MSTRIDVPAPPIFEWIIFALALLTLPLTHWGVPPYFYPVQQAHPFDYFLLIAWACWRADLAWNRQKQWRSWNVLHTFHITPEQMKHLEVRTTPAGMLLGQGFEWTRHETQVLDLAQFSRGLPTTENARGGSPALHAVQRNNNQLVVWPEADKTGHCYIQGTNRSGKSEFERVALTSAIRDNNGPVVIFDPKGSGWLMAQALTEAHLANRPFALICPYFPALSRAFNPLSTCTSSIEVMERFRPLMPISPQAPHWVDEPLRMLHNITRMHEALNRPWVMETIARDTRLLPAKMRLLFEYLRASGADLPAEPPSHMKDAIELAESVRGDDLSDDVLSDFYLHRSTHSQVTSNISKAMTGLVDTEYSYLFQSPDGLDWWQIDEQKMVVMVLTASLLLGNVADKIARLFLQDFIGYIGKRYAVGAQPLEQMTPITVIVDELSQVVYEDFIDNVNKGGEAGARFVVATQSRADLDKVLGPAGARQLIDNLRTRIYFNLADTETARIVSEGYGTCPITRFHEHDPTTINYGSASGITARRVRQPISRDVPLISPTLFARLPQGEAFARVRGAAYKIRCPLLSRPDTALLERLGYEPIMSRLYEAEKAQGEEG